MASLATAFFAAALTAADLPHPLDGILRWDTAPADGEAAIAESGGHGLVHENGVQVWMDVVLAGDPVTVTWSENDRLIWVERVRDFDDRASALVELGRHRLRSATPAAFYEQGDSIVIEWRAGPYVYGVWLGPSESAPGKWSVGWKWYSFWR